jgi:HlyD family secretion protein
VSRNSKLLLGLVVLALAAGGGWWWSTGRKDDAPTFRTAKVEKGPITATVSSTGTVNPVTSVQVGSQVSGQIKELFVDFNSPVKQGMLIARIDPETFQYRVRQAEADLEAARSAAGRAEVARINAERDLKRSKELVARNFVSPAELDRAQSTYDLAAAELKTANAVVQQRNAALASARVDLSRTEIRAPVDGVVIKRTVDVGQTVAASLQAPELFVIAKDLRDMQVETSIDEADVGRIRVGQRASFTVDAFPGRPFAGEVKTVRKAAQNVQNVVTYIAIISANNDRGELLPGMTANVRITTDSRDSVLKAPNSALRFRPPGEAPTDAKAAVDRHGRRGQGRRGRQRRRARGRGRDGAAARAAGHGTEARRAAAAAARSDLRRDAQQVHGAARPARGSARQAGRRDPRRDAREGRGHPEAGTEGEVRPDRRRDCRAPGQRPGHARPRLPAGRRQAEGGRRARRPVGRLDERGHRRRHCGGRRGDHRQHGWRFEQYASAKGQPAPHVFLGGRK